MKNKGAHYFVISAFTILYIITSLISTIHVVDFFALTNPLWLAIGLAVAFEVGAAASLASIIALHKMNKWIVWGLFLLLTGMQAMGNTYYAYVHAHDYKSWIELFGLVDEDIIYQKRILAIISGAILPIVALGFIKALVDYIKPTEQKESEIEEEPQPEPTPEISPVTTLPEVTTTRPPIIETEPTSEPVVVEEPQIETIPELTTDPQLNNLSTTVRPSREKTIDERIARGEQVPELKRPHDP